MLLMADKYSVNKRTQEISESVKLHILGMSQNANELGWARFNVPLVTF